MARKSDTESILDMFAKVGRELQMPQVEIDRIIEHHRKNLEAFEASARAASTNASSIMARQREMLEEAARDFMQTAEKSRSAGNPQDLMRIQAEYARKSFESMVRNTGEMASLMRRSGDESLEALRERVSESIREIREAFERRA